MNTVLSFMDKLYSDSETLTMVYVVGAILLFIFIIMLILSLKKTDKKIETKIIEEPKIDEEPKEVNVENKDENIIKQEKEEVKEDSLEQSIFEKTTIIPLSELDEPISREENISKALDNIENNEIKEDSKDNSEMTAQNLSNDIPNVDDFVDNIVKKTYEKNEQFSSVYVGNNTSTIKLDKVMENLNVDEEVKENILPIEEKSIEKTLNEVGNDVKEVIEATDINIENVEENIELPKKEEKIEIPQPTQNNLDKTVSLDGLKKALEEKQKEVTLKQDDLKAKLEGLKQEHPKSNETIKAEDLLNKLNSMKEK